MKIRPSTQDPYQKCSTFYSNVSRKCRLKGLDLEEISRSQRRLGQCKDGIYYLHPDAFKPTAVALGFPLPDHFFVRRLWRISCLVENYLRRVTNSNKTTFAHVPPDSYHITIVNRTHFDKHREIFSINKAEKWKSRNAIASLNPGYILLFFNGLIVSREGRVLVCGYTFDNRFFLLRNTLIDRMDIFEEHVPPAAHIKLGHILVNLDQEQLRSLLLYTSVCGEHISRMVLFKDLYTSLGRIPLSK